ncbi:hypothetical protein V8E53_002640 [Lactarius tabidus]
MPTEKEFVLAAANRLGLNLDGHSQPAKKVKLDTRKSRPAPITPQGRSASITSNTSQASHSRKRAYSPSEVVAKEPLPPKPTDGDTTPKQIHTVNFTIKQETVPPPTFVTPSTLSTIRQAVDLAQDVSLRGSTSSIHNPANAMSVDLTAIDYRTIFPPGIPAPPSNASLPPPLSWTPDFGGDQEGNDGVAPSISTATPPTDPIAFIAHRMDKAIADAMGPAQPATIAPVLTNQGTKSRVVDQGATPFLPNDEPPPRGITADIQRVDDDDAFPRIEREPTPKNRRRHNNAAKDKQRQSIPGATGPANDDGFITVTSNQSRIRPLFANVATQAALNQQQRVQLTEVAVIRFGGLQDEEAEHKFCTRNPIEIVQAVQRELTKRTKNPPAVLSGHWSVSSNTTGNFVYTLAGIISPRDLMALKPHLCSLFKGPTELVPTKGWTWIQLRQVPTEDLEHCVWGAEDLLKAFTANPCFKDALICVQPHWQGKPLNNDKMFSTVLAAIIDEDNTICQTALTHRVCMFGAQVKFLCCGDNPTLQQCGRCHMLGH